MFFIFLSGFSNFGFRIVLHLLIGTDHLLLEVNSAYYVDVQKEKPTACVYSFEGIYSNQEHIQHNRNSLELTVLSFCVCVYWIVSPVCVNFVLLAPALFEAHQQLTFRKEPR